MSVRNRVPRNDIRNSKGIPDLLSEAWEVQEGYVRELSPRDLGELYSGLNRFRYTLAEQPTFIRLFFLVRGLLRPRG